MAKFQKPKGTEDFYPEDMETKNRIFSRLKDTAKKYNFKEIESPGFEPLSLLTEKEGEEIKQQIFTLDKKGKEEFGLRFDLTVPSARMFIEKQKSIQKPVRWYMLSRMWRYEQPQKGRLREFYQFSAELFGSDKAQADAEIISMAIDCLRSLGLTEKDFFVKLNNRYLLEGLLADFIPKKKLDDVIRVIDKKSKISDEEYLEEMKKIHENAEDINKIDEILASKDLGKLKLNNEAREGYERLMRVMELLGDNIRFVKLDLSVARGLSYYTGTVFEIFDSKEKYRALAGGGRYDKMIEMFGGQPCPAIGFAIGYATLRLLLEEKKLVENKDNAVDYYIAIISKDVIDDAFKIAARLRKKYSVEIDLMERNLGNQLKFANSIKAKNVIFIGPDEVKKAKFKVKDMISGKEKEIKIEEI